MQEVAVKVAGDTYTADEFNDLPLNELQNMITLTGLTFSSTDLTQLSQAVTNLSSSAREYLDSGGANVYVLSSLNPVPPISYFEGMVVIFLPLADNTGATTLNVESIGAVPLVDSGGSPLIGGELVTTLLTRAIYSGGSFFLINVISKDVNLLNNLADQTPGSEGSLLVGHTNTTVNNAAPRAFATVKFVNFNLDSAVGQNIISAELVSTGVTNIYFDQPMDTTNYIVTGAVLIAGAANTMAYSLKFETNSVNYVTVNTYTNIAFPAVEQFAQTVDFSIQVYESR